MNQYSIIFGFRTSQPTADTEPLRLHSPVSGKPSRIRRKPVPVSSLTNGRRIAGPEPPLTETRNVAQPRQRVQPPRGHAARPVVVVASVATAALGRRQSDAADAQGVRRDVSAVSAVAADAERVGADQRQPVAVASVPRLRLSEAIFAAGLFILCF